MEVPFHISDEKVEETLIGTNALEKLGFQVKVAPCEHLKRMRMVKCL